MKQKIQWKSYKMALCAGRHEIPEAVDGAIFDSVIDPTNLQVLNNTCKERLKDCYKLDLYVTGLTVALVSVINFCVANHIGLRLWHYNRDTNDYYSQIVDTVADADLAVEAGVLSCREYGKNPWDAGFWD